MASAKLTALSETSVPALDDLVYAVDVSDATDDAAGSSRRLTVSRPLSLVPICNGRLTTESGVPASAAARTSQSVIYFSPFNGNKIVLHDGTRWVLRAFSEISLTLSGLTSGRNYDVFAYDNSGTVALELSAAWTNDSTRADAITTQDGVYVKSGATTRRWIGMIRTTSTTTTEFSPANRFVWNLHNQLPFHCAVLDSAAHSYSSSTVQEWNAGTAARANFITGLPSSWESTVSVRITTGSNAIVYAAMDGVNAGAFAQLQTVNATNVAFGYGIIAAGFHYFTIREAVFSGTSVTFDFGGVKSTLLF